MDAEVKELREALHAHELSCAEWRGEVKETMAGLRRGVDRNSRILYGVAAAVIVTAVLERVL